MTEPYGAHFDGDPRGYRTNWSKFEGPMFPQSTYYEVPLVDGKHLGDRYVLAKYQVGSWRYPRVPGEYQKWRARTKQEKFSIKVLQRHLYDLNPTVTVEKAYPEIDAKDAFGWKKPKNIAVRTIPYQEWYDKWRKNQWYLQTMPRLERVDKRTYGIIANYLKREKAGKKRK